MVLFHLSLKTKEELFLMMDYTEFMLFVNFLFLFCITYWFIYEWPGLTVMSLYPLFCPDWPSSVPHLSFVQSPALMKCCPHLWVFVFVSHPSSPLYCCSVNSKQMDEWDVCLLVNSLFRCPHVTFLAYYGLSFHLTSTLRENCIPQA